MSGSKLLNRVRTELIAKHYSKRTEQAYINWIKRYILFHNKKHPAEMGENEIRDFINHLAVKEKVSSATQNQALNSILYLYKNILKKDIKWIENIRYAQRKRHLPVVLDKSEVKKIVYELNGTSSLIGLLLYGTGLRLTEGLRLRVKDIDFGYKLINVRDGKGEKDRVTILPEIMAADLRKQINKVGTLHKMDLQKRNIEVPLPYALKKKYPNAGKEFGWQYIFPADKYI